MRRRALWLSLLAIGVVLASALVVMASTGDADPIKVAAVYNSTGGMKWLDRPGRDGFLLAAEQINVRGGVLDRRVEVVTVDGTTDTTVMARRVSELVESGDIAAVGGVNDPVFALAPLRGAIRRADGGLISFAHSEMALAVGQATQPAGIPFVTAGSTLATLPGRVGNTLYMVAAPHDEQAFASADYARDELGAATAWILTDRGHDFTTSLATAFAQRWRMRGGTVVARASYPPGELDVSAQIARLRRSGEPADVVFVASLPNEGGYLIRQLRDAGLNQPIMLADIIDARYLAVVAGDVADVYLSTHGSLDDPDDDVQDFAAAYERRYGREPESATALLGYDTMRLIASAIERAGSAEPRPLRERLAQTDGFAALSGGLSYRDGAQVPTKTITIMRLDDGEPTFVAELPPDG